MGVGCAVGALLAFVATPVFSRDPEDLRFAGIVATVFRRFANQPTLVSAMLAVPCGLGVGSLAMLCHMTWERRHRRGMGDVMMGIAVWTLVAGWGLYALTRGDVYDRYLLAFSFGIPILLVFRVRLWLVVVQLCLQGLLTAYQVASDLGPR
jgi:hypothetical protein